MTSSRHGEEEIATHAQTNAEAKANEEPRRAIVIEGPDEGRSFDLDPYSPTRILIGTSIVCGIRLSDPAVSRRHAALEPQGRRYRLTDLGSTNGTFVDGVAVVDAFVRGEEIVRLGGTASGSKRRRRPRR